MAPTHWWDSHPYVSLCLLMHVCVSSRRAALSCFALVYLVVSFKCVLRCSGFPVCTLFGI